MPVLAPGSEAGNKLLGAVAAGVAIGVGACALCCTLRRCAGCCSANSSSADSKQPVVSKETYETERLGHQYLEFHFTPGPDMFHYNPDMRLSEAFDFTSRLARKFVTYPPRHAGSALDLGCAVGQSSFEMSKQFGKVVGIDLSATFIRLAEQLRTAGHIRYSAPFQGDTTIPRETALAADVVPSKITFAVGDALNLPAEFAGPYDGLLAANLVCRVPNPRQLLNSFSRLINSGGILVLSSPYSWWEGATRSDLWIGGHPGGPRSENLVANILSEHFTLLSEANEPFLIPDHHRRYQLGFSHCTVWRRK